MRSRFRRSIATAVLLLQMAVLAVVPSWRAGAASFDPMADFCSVTPERGAGLPQSPGPAQPPGSVHPTHACGDCCVASAGPATPPHAHANPRAARDETLVVIASPAIGAHAAVLPPACGPPAYS